MCKFATSTEESRRLRCGIWLHIASIAERRVRFRCRLKATVPAHTFYGWPHDVTNEEILDRLLTLNLERAGQSNVPTGE